MGDGKPRVLLLGDSIRCQYQPLVAQQLADSAGVVGPEDNCRFSLYTLICLDRWLADLGTPSIVHWNNGLHDASHSPFRRPVQIPLDDYIGNLSLILARLRASGAKAIVWATSTPVHPAMQKSPYPYWSAIRNSDIDLYNQAAGDLMNREGIPINDLHSLVWNDYARYLGGDQLHLSPAGEEACANAVVEHVRLFL